MTKQIKRINIKGILDDYVARAEDDDDYTLYLKEAVHQLNSVDKIIFCLYIQEASMRKVAKILNISLATACIKINKIKNKILEYADRHINNSADNGYYN